MKGLNNLRSDWMNHLIGFLSALLGIYIAFRLEDYREGKNEKAKIEIAKQAIKKEIENNLIIFKENVDQLSSWLEYITFCKRNKNEKGELVAGKNEISLMIKKHSNRFRTLKEVRTLNDTLGIYTFSPVLDVVPRAGLSTSYWKTAVASGILNSMDYSLTHDLSQIYDWTEKDIGVSEKELYENLLEIAAKDGFIDLNKAISNYSDIVKAYRFKQDRIGEIYTKIKWTE
jgi:hypothetical protein